MLRKIIQRALLALTNDGIPVLTQYYRSEKIEFRILLLGTANVGNFQDVSNVLMGDFSALTMFSRTR